MKVFLRNKEIRQMLIRKNKSQNWLAYRLGISSGYISQLMDSSRSPSPKLREKFMQQFEGKSFDDLFVIEDNENK